jgi:signal transduction histidine kinase
MPVDVRDVVCPACGVDLAWAAALAERQVLASMPSAAGTPFKGDLLLPRFGEYLLRRGYITDGQLSAALIQQREAALRGTQQTIGQALFEMGAVTREQLDSASIEQVRQLQDSLQAANRHLEHRVTDRTHALQQALQQLAALSELKSNLVGNLSHSLRSPVVPIRGYSSMLIEGRLGPLTNAQRDAMETILRCANQLETAINEMGQFSANLKGQVHLQPTRLAVPELAERLRLFFTPKAETAKVRLNIALAPNLPFLTADAEKVWWALFQLIDQALKHMAGGGELTLTVSAAEGKVKFSVQDMGPSLPPTQRDEIMRLPPEFISRLADSRGWSLAQVKRIVEAHGTQFAIESQPERGTTVWFELPVVLATWS